MCSGRFGGNRTLLSQSVQRRIPTGHREFLFIDANYFGSTRTFWKYTHNAYDFGALLNTTIAVPIAWRNSKLDGDHRAREHDQPAWLLGLLDLRRYSRPVLLPRSGRTHPSRIAAERKRIPHRPRPGLPIDAESSLSAGCGRKAIRDLLEFLPREVSVRRSGSVQVVAAEDLRLGEAILVVPGGRIPVDGTVASGHSFDESRITGAQGELAQPRATVQASSRMSPEVSPSANAWKGGMSLDRTASAPDLNQLDFGGCA